MLRRSLGVSLKTFQVCPQPDYPQSLGKMTSQGVRRSGGATIVTRAAGSRANRGGRGPPSHEATRRSMAPSALHMLISSPLGTTCPDLQDHCQLRSLRASQAS